MTTLREAYYDSMHPDVPSLEQVKIADFFISKMRGMIEGKKFKGQFLHDGDIYTPEDFNDILTDLLTEIGE